MKKGGKIMAVADWSGPITFNSFENLVDLENNHLKRYVIHKNGTVTFLTLPHEHYTGNVGSFHFVNGELVEEKEWENCNQVLMFNEKMEKLIND